MRSFLNSELGARNSEHLELGAGNWECGVHPHSIPDIIVFAFQFRVPSSELRAQIVPSSELHARWGWANLQFEICTLQFEMNLFKGGGFPLAAASVPWGHWGILPPGTLSNSERLNYKGYLYTF